MSNILERIDGCWNDVDPENIKSEDKIALYCLKKKEELFSKIPEDKEVKNKNNIMIIKRSEYFSIQYEELLIFYMALIFLNILQIAQKLCASMKKSVTSQMIFVIFITLEQFPSRGI
jgi:hypothetical protein